MDDPGDVGASRGPVRHPLEVPDVPQPKRLRVDSTEVRRYVLHDDNPETVIGRRIKPRPDGCWIIDNDPDNYGQVRVAGRQVAAHRFVYETLIAPVPDGHHLHHECQVPGCCNPAHLVPLTPGEHSQRHAELRRGAA